jgi:hypothetical protein
MHILSVRLEGAGQLDRSEHRCAAFARLRQAQSMVAQLASGGQPGQGRDHGQIAEDIYACWNIWKERCRRLYDNKALPASALQQAIKFDVHQWLIAWDQVPRLRFIASFHSRVRANQVKLAMDQIPSSFTGKHISYLKTLILSCVGLFLVLSLHNGIELLRQL